MARHKSAAQIYSQASYLQDKIRDRAGDTHYQSDSIPFVEQDLSNDPKKKQLQDRYKRVGEIRDRYINNIQGEANKTMPTKYNLKDRSDLGYQNPLKTRVYEHKVPRSVYMGQTMELKNNTINTASKSSVGG